MERKALDRKPDLSVRKSLTLTDGTVIEEIGMTVRKQMQLANNKSLSDSERGMHAMAAKLLVNGEPIVYDDLLDCFSTEELEQITKFLFPDADKENKENAEKNG